MAEPHNIGLEAGKNIEEVDSRIPVYADSPTTPGISQLGRTFGGNPLLSNTQPLSAQTPSSTLPRPEQFLSTPQFSSSYNHDSSPLPLPSTMLGSPSLPLPSSSTLPLPSSSTLPLPSTTLLPRPAPTLEQKERAVYAQQQKSKELLEKFITDINQKLLVRYPGLRRVKGLSEQLSKMAIYGIYQKKKEQIFQLLHRVLSRHISPESFMQTYTEQFKNQNQMTPEKVAVLIKLLTDYGHIMQIALEAKQSAEMDSVLPMPNVPIAVPTVTPYVKPPKESKPKVKKDKAKAQSTKKITKAALKSAEKKAKEAAKKAAAEKKAADKKAAEKKPSEKKPKAPKKTSAKKEAQKKNTITDNVKAVKPPATLQKAPIIVKPPPKASMPKPTPKLSEKRALPTSKPAPKKEVEPSTEFGGALRPDESDTLAQGGIDEEDEESALIDYGPMRVLTNKNPLEDEALFLERAPLETIFKHLVSRNLGTCAGIEEDVLRYVSDATEQMLTDALEDMVRIQQHRSSGLTTASRAQLTSNSRGQLAALARLDRLKRKAPDADDTDVDNSEAHRVKMNKDDFWLRANYVRASVGGPKTGTLFKRLLQAKN
eukprot:m.51178 g.51178  ORF g.51178 m.51178 type:complete len:597 (+) comp21407_c0_seq1:210-2000(+)